MIMNAKTKESLKKKYPGLPVEDVIGKSPTQSKDYIIWALEQLKAKKSFAETIAALELFHRNKKHLVIKKISQFKDPEDLTKLFRNTVLDLSSNAARKIAKAGARKIFEDNEWLLLEPLTSYAAALYGKGTQWCTSVQDGTFEEYTCQNDGLRICILINKKSEDKRYSKFAFVLGGYDGDEIMDAQDNPVYLDEEDDYGERCDCPDCREARGETNKRPTQKQKNKNEELFTKLEEFRKLARKNCHGLNLQSKLCDGKLVLKDAKGLLDVSGPDILAYMSHQAKEKYQKLIVQNVDQYDPRLWSHIQLLENLFWDNNMQEAGVKILTIPDELYTQFMAEHYFGRCSDLKERINSRRVQLCQSLGKAIPLELLAQMPESLILQKVSEMEEASLNELAKHTSAKIRTAVALAPKSKKELIQLLINDKEEEVRKNALQRLNKTEVRALLKTDYEDKFNAAIVLSKKLSEKELANLILGA